MNTGWKIMIDIAKQGFIYSISEVFGNVMAIYYKQERCPLCYFCWFYWYVLRTGNVTFTILLVPHG